MTEFLANSVFGADNDEASIQALTELAGKQPNVFARIRDWIRNLIERLGIDPHNKTLAEELKYIADRLERVYRSEDKKPPRKATG